ncbi:CYTH and CHAD domain-containing protein [Streptomyces sp. NBC_00083]|uniref:CYTH and CHAD domain-containing protein n=1 Tax=Streptomyces sp. NBC_00083 TaxID=2975647 RepID=UPI00224DAC8C|nr:CYTH and CHAD domain-containing protein [Streptomyces sp. NBC_00083]MCX5382452.1 CYTH and CHAD domain-containing protein [Streptomyces sp. NBC_00083]
MADTKREIERKFEFPASHGDRPRLPELTRVPGIAGVVDQGVVDLDAVYYDTPDLRLDAGSLTLRRRTGGADAGWHLKLPVSEGVRDEVRAPLCDEPPPELTALVRARVRAGRLVPVVRLLSSREVRHLLADDGTLLAELSIDTVRAEGLTEGASSTAWTEIEVELADGVHDESILDGVEKQLRKAGIRPSTSASKVARALRETAPPQAREDSRARADGASGGTGDASGASGEDRACGRAAEPADGTAGAEVLRYLRRQRDVLVAHDPAVRRDLPDAVHRMRVATRRLRSAFRSYAKVVDRAVTDPLGDELKWLAGELGADRDREVLTQRLRAHLKAVPRTLRLGPVRARLRVWSAARSAGTRRRTLAVLDGERYLALLDALDALLAAPPLRPAAARPAAEVLAKAVLKDHRRLAGRIDTALALAPGRRRDIALHEARKAAKRARYAAEAAKPLLGGPAKKAARRVKAVQGLLGDHQDSVVARETLRLLAAQAHAAGESAFTWGLLYGREEAAAALAERELPAVWARAAKPKLRRRLRAAGS